MRRKNTQGGNSLIEFALSVSLLVLLFSGAFRFGYTFHVYNQLEAAVRQGARYASIATYDSATVTPSTSYSTAVKNVVVYGTPTFTGTETPIVSGLTTSHVVVTPIFVNNVPFSVRVRVTGFTVNALFRTYTLSGKPSAIFPHVGVYAPL